jgi:DNA-binding MarR family transcriptional regulator
MTISSDNAPTSVLDCNLFAMRQAARFVTQMYERHMAPVGVTAAQFTILSRLERKPGMTMLELAEAMVMERTTLVRALKPMQRDALISAAPAATGPRVHGFWLTAAGRQRYRQARIAWRAAQAEFESHYGASRAEGLRRELFALTDSSVESNDS